MAKNSCNVHTWNVDTKYRKHLHHQKIACVVWYDRRSQSALHIKLFNGEISSSSHILLALQDVDYALYGAPHSYAIISQTLHPRRSMDHIVQYRRNNNLPINSPAVGTFLWITPIDMDESKLHFFSFLLQMGCTPVCLPISPQMYVGQISRLID